MTLKSYTVGGPNSSPLSYPYRFLSLTLRSVKRTEPLILTVRFLAYEREPYRINMATVIRLLLRTVPIYILVRYGSRSNTKKRTG